MITIHKYPIPIEDEFEIEMPGYSRIISVDTQRNSPCIWVEVDTEGKMVKHRFILKGTGHPFTEEQVEMLDTWIPVGTFMMYDDALVFHLYFDVSR